MKYRCLLTYPLTNGLTLVCLDRSKKIAADRWYIGIGIEIAIPVEKRWLDGLSVDEERFQQIQETLGDKVIFKQRKERNFISDDQKDEIVQQIIKNITEIADNYFCKKAFPGKYLLKEFAGRKFKQ